MITHVEPRTPAPGASRNIDGTDPPATPTEHRCPDRQTTDLIRSCAPPHPQPLQALRAQQPHPVVIGLIRPDLHACRNQAIASAVSAADLHAIQAIADQYQWQVADMLRLQPGGDTDSADPVECLLAQVRSRGVDAVIVPRRLHLEIGDLRERDSLAAVRRECAVVTLAPAQLWPCTTDFAPVFGTADVTRTASSSSAPEHGACHWLVERW